MKKLKLVLTVFMALIGTALWAQPVLELVEDEHNFTVIKEDGGKVQHVFGFKNTGDKTLFINDVKTPCGCTTPFWTKDSIPPGKGGYVEAVFDPLHRPGVFDKILTIETNATPPRYYITIRGEVLPRKRTVLDKYPSKRGNLRFKLPQIYMGKVNSNEIDTIHLGIYNEGGKTITVSKVISPPHIRTEILTGTIKPGGFGKIIIKYDAVKRADLGFLTDQITLVTDDSVEPNKEMMVMAEVELYFGALTPAQLEAAPVIKIDQIELDFGTITEGEIAKGKFAISNEGKSDLKIIRVIPECGCTSTKAPNAYVHPGETTYLEVEFDSENQVGIATKLIDLYSSDPINSHIKLKLTAVVIEKKKSN